MSIAPLNGNGFQKTSRGVESTPPGPGRVKDKYCWVKYVNLSMGSIGTIFKESSIIENTFHAIGMEEHVYAYLVKKVMEICIRSTYYIFCKRGKDWENPDSLTW